MATVKDQVGEVLLGTSEEPQLSQLTRAAFMKYAQKDESGEYYLNEDSFITAVAPESEDFVSGIVTKRVDLKLTTLSFPAQNQEIPVWHPLLRSRSRPQGQGQSRRLVCLPKPPREARCRVRSRLSLLRQEQDWIYQL